MFLNNIMILWILWIFSSRTVKVDLTSKNHDFVVICMSLLGSDLLPLGLLLLEALQFLLFLGALLAPLVDVLLQLLVQLSLFGLPSGLEKITLASVEKYFLMIANINIPPT